VAKQDYKIANTETDLAIAALFNVGSLAQTMAALRIDSFAQAQFLWAITRDLFHYCAYHLAEIADNARDLDLATRWGFGWKLGPFESWQIIGWQQVIAWINEDIAKGKALAKVPLPGWATEPSRDKVHYEDGSYSPTGKIYKKRSALPVYKRQLFPDKIIGEKFSNGTTIFQNDAVRFWHLNDDIGILSFNSKVHAIGGDVLDGILRALDEAEKNFSSLVIWQTEPPFSAGANLAQVVALIKENNYAMLEKFLEKFQLVTQRIKYSGIPTVAAVQGLALGGGCEFVMHCPRVVAALESYIGLVEVGVGLIPAGGGCKEIALRAAVEAKGGDVFPFVQKYFQRAAMANVSKSALEAKQFGYLTACDTVIMNPYELLYTAKNEARHLSEAGYKAPLKARNIPVAGKTGIANLKMMLVNMKEGGFISEHDYEIGSHLATAMCGGEVEVGSLVDEDWLLRLERESFMELLKNPKTHARIEHMLKTNKPLRN
jgi:3-hydroxyacyl-CoA dehydrogenase